MNVWGTPLGMRQVRDRLRQRLRDFGMSDEEVVEKVGSVVATGLDVYDPTELDEYRYTRFENVLTSLSLNGWSMPAVLPRAN